MSGGTASKEETFETSSFFDEGVGSQKGIAIHGVPASPHRCNQVEIYSIPTIFNTLMFGIDQSKVSENVRDSFVQMQKQQTQAAANPKKPSTN